MFSKSQFHGAGFDAIVELRCRAVIVEIVHCFGRHLGLFERERDRAGGFLSALLQTHAMIGFAGGTVAGDFTQNASPAGLRFFAFFEHEEPGAFGDHESTAVAREGT
jgi:hypothetical protein